MNYRACALGLLSLLFATCGVAQQLTPRAFWPAPVGTNVLVLGYQRSEGDIVVDQSLPITGVDSTIDYVQVSFQRSIDVFGRSGSLQISQSLADGTTSGFVDGELQSRRTVGPQDLVGRVAVNFLGAPAMDRETFREAMRDPDPQLGASLTVSVPTGEYEADRIINLGTNRVSIRPALGGIYPLSPSLLLEVEVGVWWFEDNDDFRGATREQDPVFDAQMHLVKQFSPGFWASLDANYYTGGKTKIDGVRNSDLQRNSRFGATVVFPLGAGRALRFSGSLGTVTQNGGDYDILSVSWIQAF